jgi:hypothetical protein
MKYIPDNAMCVSRCGMILEKPPATNTSGDVAFSYYKPSHYWTCENFQLAEDSILTAFELYVNKSTPETEKFANACEQLEGYTVRILPDATFKVAGQELLGLTQCYRQLILISNQPWHESSLAHEMAHAIQGCSVSAPANMCQDVTKESPWPRIRECTGHYKWPENGIDAASVIVEYSNK